jgi:hypothetical protein
VEVGARAVVQVGEGGVAGGEVLEAPDQRVEPGEQLAVHIGGHLGARLARDEVEEHVLAEVVQPGVVELEAAVALVVLALRRRHGLDVWHERAIPRPLPAESERTVEVNKGLPTESLFEGVPGGDEGRRMGGADQRLRKVGQHGIDRLFREELRRSQDRGVRPVGRLGRVAEAAERADPAHAGFVHGFELGVEHARVGHAHERLMVPRA